MEALVSSPSAIAMVAQIQRERRDAAEARIRAFVSMSMLRDLPEAEPGGRIGAHRVHLAAGCSPLGLINPGKRWQEKRR